MDAVVCANPDVVRALMPVSKSFQIVSFRGSPVFAEASIFAQATT